VRAEGVQLGGLDRETAAAALIDLEDRLVSGAASFRVKDSLLDLDAAAVAFRLDRSSMVETALAVGRNSSAAGEFWWWVTHWFSEVELDVAATVDGSALEKVLEVWDEQAVGQPPFDGAITLDGRTPVPEYPHGGEAIDRNLAPGLVVDQLSRVNRETIELPVVQAEPTLTVADIDRGVERAKLLLAGSVTLIDPDSDRQVEFTVDQLVDALRIDVDGQVVFSFDAEVVSRVLTPLRAELEKPPVDGRLEIDGFSVTLVPGVNGTVIDANQTALNLATAAASAARRGVLPIVEGAEPAVTTEQLESLDIRHLVSQFTTYHRCCENRVTNIHLIADKVDGAIVLPGDTFSLNEFVGERTVELGYSEDGTIIGGRLEPTVGGGVSQFATTFYNAVFWGGYEDVEHRNHSFYFTRYPLGVEATISWPLPDLKFRNNSASAILIKTEYTSESITVMFFANNDGRVVTGRQLEGITSMSVEEEGGQAARRIAVTVSEAFGFNDPPPPLYEADPLLAVDQQVVVQSALQGFSVIVERTTAIGALVTTDEWVVRYRPRQEIIKVHPCMVPVSDPAATTAVCPTTTTVPVATTAAP
jgi:vancomycin resistance protein YoaR